MKGRGAANSAFFSNAGSNDVMQGGAIEIAAPKRNPNIDYAA